MVRRGAHLLAQLRHLPAAGGYQRVQQSSCLQNLQLDPQTPAWRPFSGTPLWNELSETKAQTPSAITSTAASLTPSPTSSTTPAAEALGSTLAERAAATARASARRREQSVPLTPSESPMGSMRGDGGRPRRNTSAQFSSPGAGRWEQPGAPQGRARTGGVREGQQALSAPMQRFEAKLESLRREGGDLAAAALFEEMMEDGMKTARTQAGATTGLESVALPLEYRPNKRMMLAHVQSLKRIYVLDNSGRAQGTYMSRASSAELSAPQMREYLARVKSAAEIVKAAGLPQLESVFEAELDALRGLGDVTNIRACYLRLKESGLPVTLSCANKVYLTVIHCPAMSPEERIVEAHIIMRDLMARSAAWEPNEKSLIARALNRLLRMALGRRNSDEVLRLRVSLSEGKMDVEQDIQLQYIYNAAEDDDARTLEMLLTYAVDQLQMPIKELPPMYTESAASRSSGSSDGSSSAMPSAADARRATIPFKLPQGVMLSVLQCAVRTASPELATRAFRLLGDSMARPTYHSPDYYAATQQHSTRERAPPPVPTQHAIPSLAAHHALIHAHVAARHWAGAWAALSLMESRYGALHPDTLSPYHGLSYFAVAVSDIEVVQGAFTALESFVESQKPGADDETKEVVCPGLYLTAIAVLMRGTALRGSVDDTNKLFGALEGQDVKPNADVYTAVLETAIVSKQLAMAPKIMEFIRSKDGMGKPPAPEAYDLLIRAYMAAEDVDGMLGALALLSRDGMKARPQTLHMALRVALKAKHTLAITTLQTALTFAQDMPLPEYRSRLGLAEGTRSDQLALRIQQAGDLNRDRYGYLPHGSSTQMSIST